MENPEAERLLFENNSLSSSRLSFKNDKNKCVCFNEIIWVIITKLKMKVKYKSQRYESRISRHRF